MTRISSAGKVVFTRRKHKRGVLSGRENSAVPDVFRRQFSPVRVAEPSPPVTPDVEQELARLERQERLQRPEERAESTRWFEPPEGSRLPRDLVEEALVRQEQADRSGREEDLAPHAPADAGDSTDEDEEKDAAGVAVPAPAAAAGSAFVRPAAPETDGSGAGHVAPPAVATSAVVSFRQAGAAVLAELDAQIAQKSAAIAALEGAREALLAQKATITAALEVITPPPAEAPAACTPAPRAGRARSPRTATNARAKGRA